MEKFKITIAFLVPFLFLVFMPIKANVPSLWIQDLTWQELEAAIDSAYTNIIIPTAGIEQNGPHMPLNKHEKVVAYASEKIAKKLGKTLIAPVLNFVPEEGHMKFPGTISISDETFISLLVEISRSLKKHGFKNIYFLGDSYENQDPQSKAALKLQSEGINAFHIASYYANRDQYSFLAEKGWDSDQRGGHAGLRDTSEFMAVSENYREDKLKNYQLKNYRKTGSFGEVSLATKELGEILIDIKVESALKEIGAP